MADTKLSDLSAGGAVAGTDIIYVVETSGSGGVKKTLTQVQEFVEDELNGAFIEGDNITITYDDGAGTFTFDNTAAPSPADTDDLPEGSTNLYYTAERARDDIGTALTAGTGITVTPNDGADTITIATTITQYTDELAQDAVGGILTDSSEIDFTYNDGAPSITAVLVAGSIDETKLDTSVNASLDLADSATQPGDNVSDLTNDAGYVSDLSSFDTGDLAEGSNLYFTDERAQDAVGAMVDSTLVYTDGTPLLSRAALTGDVTASGGSNSTTIADDAVTYAKMQNTAAGFVVLGKATTGGGDPGEISLGVDEVLRRSGSGNVAGGTLVTNNIGNSQVTYAKVQNVSATDRILGRSTAGAGIIEEIICNAQGRGLLSAADAAALRVIVGVVIGTDVQQFSAILAAIAGLTLAADKIIQFTGASSAVAFDLKIGTWTPTATAIANLDSVTGLANFYIQIGDKVIVAGLITVDPTAAANTATTARWTLPVASAFSSSQNASGVIASSGVQRAGRVQANVTFDELEFTFASEMTAASNMVFIAMYTII